MFTLGKSRAGTAAATWRTRCSSSACARTRTCPSSMPSVRGVGVTDGEQAVFAQARRFVTPPKGLVDVVESHGLELEDQALEVVKGGTPAGASALAWCALSRQRHAGCTGSSSW